MVSSLDNFSQESKKIELIGADNLMFDKALGSYKKLIGNVALKHENIYMYCDSAHLYSEDNSMDAFGNIHIKEGDTLDIYGDFLKYNGNSRKAEVKDNVKLIDKEMTLTSNILNYDLSTDIGDYYGGGKIVDKKNTLTSNLGYYYAKKKEFFFKENVVLVNPEYVMNSDTLKYNTFRKVAYFYGPSIIKGKTDFIYCQNGWYDTQHDISQFSKNAYLSSKEHVIKGDSLYYDKKMGMGKAFRNVHIIDTTQKILITGDYGYYLEKTEYSFVTKNAVFSQKLDADTIFLHADTLISSLDSSGLHRVLFAYHKAKFFKKDLQGMCDSLVYTSVDSTFHLFHLPILWSEENQLTAQRIDILTKNKSVDRIFLDNTAFIASQADTGKYNQIKGKIMTGYFKESELKKIIVEGNGETLYYVQEDKEGLIGINKAEATNLLIFINKNKFEKISFISSPVSVLHPPDKISDADLLLKDFLWHSDRRPLYKEDIFCW